MCLVLRVYHLQADASFVHHNTLTAQHSCHFFIGSGLQTKPGGPVMFKCVLAFLGYRQPAEFRLQNAFYFHVLHRMDGNSETYENVLGRRILWMLSGPCVRIVPLAGRSVGWVSSPGSAVLWGCGLSRRCLFWPGQVAKEPGVPFGDRLVVMPHCLVMRGRLNPVNA